MAAIVNFINTVSGRNKTDYVNNVPMKASEVINAYGYRYYTMASGVAALTIISDTQVDGFILTCYQPDHSGATTSSNATPFTCSATTGKTVLEAIQEIYDPNAAVWGPCYTGETLTSSSIGAKCDLAVLSNIQYVRPSVTTHKHVIILDVDLENNLALIYANAAAS